MAFVTHSGANFELVSASLPVPGRTPLRLSPVWWPEKIAEQECVHIYLPLFAPLCTSLTVAAYRTKRPL